MKLPLSRSSVSAGVLMFATLSTVFPQLSVADDGDSYYDMKLEATITKEDWLSRNRDLDPVSLVPGQSVSSSFKGYKQLECADFDVKAPEGWITTSNSETGVIGITAPLNASPGDYEIVVTDSSECFPTDSVDSVIKATVDAPEVQYKINDKEELVAVLQGGEERVLGNRAHNSEDVGITGYTLTDNGVMSVKTVDGRFHNLYGDTKMGEYKDNAGKGIFSLSYDHDGNGIIIATDGSMYVIDGMKDNLSITNMSVVGEGQLIVVTSDGTAHDLGILRESIYEGISSVFMGANKSLNVSTTGGRSYTFNENNNASKGKPQGVIDISLSDSGKAAVTTDENSIYTIDIEDKTKESPNPGEPGFNREVRNEGDPKDGGEYVRNGYTYVPKNPSENQIDDRQGFWDKITEFFRS